MRRGAGNVPASAREVRLVLASASAIQVSWLRPVKEQSGADLRAVKALKHRRQSVRSTFWRSIARSPGRVGIVAIHHRRPIVPGDRLRHSGT
jgi:hypothetical protein